MASLYKSPTNPSSGNNSNRSCDTTSQSCPLQEDNWIDLEYLYCDGTGVAGACYTVINNDDGNVVAQGVLNSKGFAHCPLPINITNVSYNFYSDPSTLTYRKQPIANSEQTKIKPGWSDRMSESIAAAGTWTWGTIQGDFNEDQTVGQIAANAAITMIPIVDQAGDIRDIAAQLKFLIWDKRYDDKWVWIALVITLIGLVPVLGSAAKGVLKVIAKGLKEAGKVPLKYVIEVLNTFHKGDAITWLRQLAADLPTKHGSKIKKDFLALLLSFKLKLESLKTYLPTSLSKHYDDLMGSIDEITNKVVREKKIDEAVKELQDGLNKSLDEKVNFTKDGSIQSNNRRFQSDTEPPKLPDLEFPRTQAELDKLAMDPAHGGKISPKSIAERDVGLGLENKGEVPGPIIRDPNPAGGEFIDGKGQVWDVKGPNSNFPPRKGGFDLVTDANKIDKSLKKGENVMLDTRKMTPDHVQDLKQEGNLRNWGDTVKYWP